ncbi:YidH family protein [Mucilaginibacter phyllosphaerae]
MEQFEKPRTSPSDHLANERTFLAWIRTSIALMGFGFVVVKFSLFIWQISIVLTDKSILPGKGYSSFIGILLVAIGALMALLAFFRYKRTERQLMEKNYEPSFLLSLLLTIFIVIMSGLLLYYLLPSL